MNRPKILVIGAGVREIIELNLNEQERASLETCALNMKAQISSLKGLYIS
jgi:malate/lactate dehydrogenase